MNKLIVQLFIFFVEVFSGILLLAVLASGFFVWSSGHQWESIAIVIVGTISIVVAFGFLSIVIEIHRDLRFLRENQTKATPASNLLNRDIEHTL